MNLSFSSVFSLFGALNLISVVSCTFDNRFDTPGFPLADSPLNTGRDCFCKLKGQIDDCSCSVDTVDYFNNAKIFPRLISLIQKDYFRFFKVNLKKECPFWVDDGRCSMRTCHVKTCLEEDIPPGLKGSHEHRNENMALKYLKPAQEVDSCDDDADLDPELGYLNTTISDSAYKGFELWQAYDEAQDNFCTLPDDDGEAHYVDLMLNPERYTGYKGESAHRTWRTIYMENCFRPKKSKNYYITSSKLSGLCLEKRVFYRAISGLHASINIHLCANYLFSGRAQLNPLARDMDAENWGYNLEEFKRRFSPESTDKEGPQWLRNLYFVYLLELKAVAKAAPYLSHEKFYTGHDVEDYETKVAVMDLLNVIKSFPEHFDETSMFLGGSQGHTLKEEFRQHFRNISRIMDCVGCEKCKLWGKLQTQGLGTALKILFSGKFDELTVPEVSFPNRSFRLERSEIVALFNALGRLSTSIHEIEVFRQMMRDFEDITDLQECETAALLPNSLTSTLNLRW